MLFCSRLVGSICQCSLLEGISLSILCQPLSLFPSDKLIPYQKIPIKDSCYERHGKWTSLMLKTHSCVAVPQLILSMWRHEVRVPSVIGFPTLKQDSENEKWVPFHYILSKN